MLMRGQSHLVVDAKPLWDIDEDGNRIRRAVAAGWLGERAGSEEDEEWGDDDDAGGGA